MGFFDTILKVALPTLGNLIAPGIGGALGGAVAGGIDVYQAGQAQKKMQQERDAANAANNARYQQAIGLYSDTLNKARAMNDEVSRQDVIDINDAYDTLGRNTTADLAARGLSNTTIAPTLHQGITKERTASLTRANDARLQRTIQMERDLTGDLARTIEHRVDQGPSYQDAAVLAGAAGQAQAAMGGSLKQVLEEMTKRQKPDAGETSKLFQNYAPGVFDTLLNSKTRTRYA